MVKQKRKKRSDEEHKIQSEFISIIRSYEKEYPLLELMYAVPNGGNRSMSEAIKIKLEGGTAGVPDIAFPFPNGKYASLYLEFKKSSGGVVSQNQKDYIKLLQLARNRVEVVRDVRTALNLVIEHTGYDLEYYQITKGIR